MFTIVKNKVYLVENDKMFPVNVSIENGVQKVGQEQDLPKGYQVYTLNEILVKFNIKLENPYYFDKEKYEKELAEAKEKAEAELKAQLKEEVRKELEAEAEKEKAKPQGAKPETNKPEGTKPEGNNPKN